MGTLNCMRPSPTSVQGWPGLGVAAETALTIRNNRVRRRSPLPSGEEESSLQYLRNLFFIDGNFSILYTFENAREKLFCVTSV